MNAEKKRRENKSEKKEREIDNVGNTNYVELVNDMQRGITSRQNVKIRAIESIEKTVRAHAAVGAAWAIHELHNNVVFKPRRSPRKRRTPARYKT